MAYSPAGTRSGKNTGAAIQIEGLSAFRNALKAVSPDAEKELRTTIRGYGKRALGKARSRTPVGSRPKYVDGKLVPPGGLKRSVKLSVTQREAALYSDSPYARAHEWGTSGDADSRVQPRGVPIMIERSQMLGHAVYFYRTSLGYDLANLINKTAKRNGIDATPTVRRSRWDSGGIISLSN